MSPFAGLCLRRSPRKLSGALLPAANSHTSASGRLALLDLPMELVADVVAAVASDDHSTEQHANVEQDLLRLAATSQALRELACADALWAPLFAKRFGGPPSSITQAAAKAAGSWLALTQAKVLTDKEAAPWRKPTRFELAAALDAMTAGAGGSDGEPLTAVFLVDSSGSVGDDDWSEMTAFVNTAADSVASKPHHKLAVVQFSTDSRVEVELAPLADKEAFSAALAGMKRLNGGTNIAAAIAKAGALLKDEPPGARRVLILLTDGRIDGHQGREAASMARWLGDEQANVRLHAFGVGRGVDVAELLRIIEAPMLGRAKAEAAAERYLDLCVRDDAPW